ncbi:Wzz/FepE/Etk N-terminal domain-containing protein [Oscillospiraceae bacterium WX1]
MHHKELDLRQIFLIFRKNLFWILLAMLLGGGVSFSIFHFLVTPKYVATTSLYVFSNADRTLDAITSSELTASQELVNTYIVVLKSDTVLEKVISTLNLSMTPDDIRAMMSAGAIDATEAFRVSITSSDAREAQMIANTIAAVAPAEIIRVVKAGGVEVIDYAKQPDKPSSPHVLFNTLLGVLAGFVVSFGFRIAAVWFDTRVHGEEDLQQLFTIPVLGTVPSLAAAQS